MKKHLLVFHPLLFGLYSVLAIASTDPSTIFFKFGYPALFWVGALSLLVYAGFYYGTRNTHRAGLLATLLLTYVFFYGHIYRVLRDAPLPAALQSHWLLFVFWTALFAAIVWRIALSPLGERPIMTQFLNVVALATLVVPVYGSLRLAQMIYRDPLTSWEKPALSVRQLTPAETLPDIYYIILDGYGREDVLNEVYGWDNTAFTGFLEQSGFYVAEQSASNYMRTNFSLSSSLNMNYVDKFIPVDTLSANWYPLYTLMHENQAFSLLQQAGYQTIAFSSDYYPTEMRQVERYLSRYPALNEFDQLLLGTSILAFPVDAGLLDLPVFSYRTHANRINYIFDYLPQVNVLKAQGRPAIVFAHIVAPHPPFVFAADGSLLQPQSAYSIDDASDFSGTQEEYRMSYRAQLAYVNKRMQQVIEQLLRQSPQPIIIVQGDHGPGSLLDWDSLEQSCLRERFSILNAYYFPDSFSPTLYPEITPVNSFRLTLNQVLGTQFDLLPDRSYANFGPAYQFQDITDQLQAPCAP